MNMRIDKLAMTSKEALQTAIGIADDANAGAVEPVHLLSALLTSGERNISVIIERIGADPKQLARATQQAVDGKTWPGYKLVAGRSVRKYTSEAEVIRAATEAGYTDIYKTTLLGVGDLEKRMGRKKFSEVLGRYIVKPMGAPQLVPESDPRKPYADAAGDFSDKP